MAEGTANGAGEALATGEASPASPLAAAFAAAGGAATVYPSREVKELVGKCYSQIQAATGRLGGSAINGPIYGEMTQASMQRFVTFLAEECELGADSTFMDIGAGLGKPSIHVAAATDCKQSLGMECELVRWLLSLSNLSRLCSADGALREVGAMRAAAGRGGPRVAFAWDSVLHWPNFDPVTHLFVFDCGMPPLVMSHIATAVARSTTVKYVVHFRSPRQLVGFGYSQLTEVHRMSCSMHGSGESHTGYIYRVNDQRRASSRPATQLVAAAARQEPAQVMGRQLSGVLERFHNDWEGYHLFVDQVRAEFNDPAITGQELSAGTSSVLDPSLMLGHSLLADATRRLIKEVTGSSGTNPTAGRSRRRSRNTPRVLSLADSHSRLSPASAAELLPRWVARSVAEDRAAQAAAVKARVKAASKQYIASAAASLRAHQRLRGSGRGKGRGRGRGDAGAPSHAASPRAAAAPQPSRKDKATASSRPASSATSSVADPAPAAPAGVVEGAARVLLAKAEAEAAAVLAAAQSRAGEILDEARRRVEEMRGRDGSKASASVPGGDDAIDPDFALLVDPDTESSSSEEEEEWGASETTGRKRRAARAARVASNKRAREEDDQQRAE